jgi:hypothetical protein
MALSRTIQAEFLQQIAATAAPLNSISAVLVFLGVFLTIAYFVYTLKFSGVASGVPRVGRILMMIGFGAAFGSATGRLALVVGRFQFLLRDWLGLIQ